MHVNRSFITNGQILRRAGVASDAAVRRQSSRVGEETGAYRTQYRFELFFFVVIVTSVIVNKQTIESLRQEFLQLRANGLNALHGAKI